ncbi:MAG: 2-oxoacid:acceptor oxidoreductase family protein [Acidimicrobiia bacterium]|nr:2-oxoacid:acceptor oxidoreductase family protein [Acidimicrobiia bacterium]
MEAPKYPGIRITTNGNQLVSYHTEARITQAGVFYPITPSTEMGEDYQRSFAEGVLDVFGNAKIAIETEGEHAAQGGAIAYSMTGHRTVNFTSGQGIVYGLEQYYHAPGKLSTMVVEVAARALTKHALNVHCGHDDVYSAMDTGWIMLFAKDAQQAADQAVILRKVTELSLNPGMNIQDGFLTSHLERTFYKHEAELLREYLGAHDDIIETPTEAQRVLFGPTRRRVPIMMDLTNPMLIGPVQNQEHYMNGVLARRNNFSEDVLPFLEAAYTEWEELTGRHYGFVTEYKTDDAETVFVSLGSAAENIEAAVDYLRAEDDASVGSIHINVLRPFPEAAIVKALAGKRRVIILERADDGMSGDNQLTREIRSSLNKALEVGFVGFDSHIQGLTEEDTPLILSGSYGLGSRDFRPEAIIGAYEYAVGLRARQDGRTLADGETYFTLGIDHPYAVGGDRTPSLLPEGAIAVRFHSIGGWGMITTGKNLSEVIGAIGDDLLEHQTETDEFGRLEEVIHVSANPKYGSEKKGAPTSYFLVAAPKRIRPNCDLQHVDVVLCCDPKIFTHTNPLVGLNEGGTFVWESEEDPETVWERIPSKYRQEIIDKKIRIVTLAGFRIARAATSRSDLQLRMQGNAFLGAFFAVSGILEEFDVSDARFRELVHNQYKKKFGRFGDAVIESNMTVMTAGFDEVRDVPYGDLDAPDRSSMRLSALTACGSCTVDIPAAEQPVSQVTRIPLTLASTFNEEFKAGLGYHQPATPLSSVSMMAAGTGRTASKYVARREVPVWIAENCTGCMDCIVACPDTALPNVAQDLDVVLGTAARAYILDLDERAKMVEALPDLEVAIRVEMLAAAKAKESVPFVDILRKQVAMIDTVGDVAKDEFMELFERVSFAYTKTPHLFRSLERSEPGSGGLFAIMVSDLCKGCAECVLECPWEALEMAQETPTINADHMSGINFIDMLPDTPAKYLGRFDPDDAMESAAAHLKNHLMVKSNYEALVSGDGACAGCGEKSVLHAVASLTEAYMRPLYHAKADRLDLKALDLEEHGLKMLREVRALDVESYDRLRMLVAHSILGLGGETIADTSSRIAAHGDITDEQIVEALVVTMRQDAFNHRDLQAIDGTIPNGMSVMAMGAHTGCNTVYGSTPPNNPHPYPWMNSLFQDGATITWLLGESFIADHARRSVIPERLADTLMLGVGISEDDYFELTHMTDNTMTEREIRELPKAWAIGGDGGMGDIGYQNVSKVVLQNRPNVKLLMLDTQVYSNTGGQNSDSTPMPGGGDMNQFGEASQGKLTEKKGVAETFISGHGSAFVAQVSLANTAQFYKSILDALDYRGTAFIQSYTTCQPEHGVADDVSTQQAGLVRDSRGMPQFVLDPQLGETYQEALDISGNPNRDRDWTHITSKLTDRTFQYTVAHFATTEARFRRHLKPVASTEGLAHLDDMLLLVNQRDVVARRVFDPTHRSFVPDFGVYIEIEDAEGNVRPMSISRKMVLFCVERRKAWRMLQSNAGITNVDYEAQKVALASFDEDDVPFDDRFTEIRKRFDAALVVPAL